MSASPFELVAEEGRASSLSDEAARSGDAYDNWVPAPVPLAFVLARARHAVVTVDAFHACPTGFGFDLTIRVDAEPAPGIVPDWLLEGAPAASGLAPELFRFALVYPDGAAVTDGLSTAFRHAAERPGDGPWLFSPSAGGGAGMPTVVRRTFYASPPPAAGRLEFVCEWPAHGIAPARHAVAAEEIAGAAARALPVRGSIRVPGHRATAVPVGCFEPEIDGRRRRVDASRPVLNGEQARFDLLPREWLGAPLALILPLAESATALIALTGFRAFPWGFDFVLSIRAHEEDFEALDAAVWDHETPRDWDRAAAEGELHPDLLRVGIHDAHGHTAYATGSRLMRRSDESDGLAIEGADLGGGLSGGRLDVGFRVLPLPPSGPLTFAVEWPRKEVAATAVTVDADELRTAGQAAALVWPPGQAG